MHRLQRKILFGDVGHEFTDAQWRQIRQRVHQLAGRKPGYIMLQTLPGMLPLAAIPFWITFRKHFSIAWNFFFELTFAVALVGFVLWGVRRVHRRYVFQAIVDLNYATLCPRCGYDLGRLDDATRCPECGHGAHD